jgi:hypothetical protein
MPFGWSVIVPVITLVAARLVIQEWCDDLFSEPGPLPTRDTRPRKVVRVNDRGITECVGEVLRQGRLTRTPAPTYCNQGRQPVLRLKVVDAISKFW